MGRVIIYIEDTPNFLLSGGLAHIDFKSGDTVFQCVMPTPQFGRALLYAGEALAKWQIEELDAQEANPPLPFRRKQRK